MRILIAEDDPTSRTILAVVLKKCGHDVLETASGTEAWAALQAPHAPRLAILDWMMPEMDGLDVCRHVRAIETNLPPYIIMLTALDDKKHLIEALNAGADDYVPKPFDPGELRARVEVGRRMVDMQACLAAQIRELRDALDQVKTLRGILPICANCKKIRDDKGYWNQVEVYVRDHSEAQFSHGICPECVSELYPGLLERGDHDAKEG